MSNINGTDRPISIEHMTYDQFRLYARESINSGGVRWPNIIPQPPAEDVIIDLASAESHDDSPAEDLIIDLASEESNDEAPVIIRALTHEEACELWEGPSIAQERPTISDIGQNSARGPLWKKKAVAVIKPTINTEIHDSSDAVVPDTPPASNLSSYDGDIEDEIISDGSAEPVISVGNEGPENEIFRDDRPDSTDNAANWTESQMRDWETASWEHEPDNSQRRDGRQTPFAFQEPDDPVEGTEEELPEVRQNAANETPSYELFQRFSREFFNRQETFFNEVHDHIEARFYQLRGHLDQRLRDLETQQRHMQADVVANLHLIIDNLYEQHRERRLIVWFLCCLNEEQHSN
ncbi:uncharacterized protein [Garra rufa]|uniref:uncharacterized protein n=1 Tax=Garra rufa TaxID=137080 RepID=UPI003CCEBB4A